MNQIKCAAKCQRDDTAVSQSLIVNKGPGVSDKNPIDYKHLRSYFMFVFKKGKGVTTFGLHEKINRRGPIQ